MLDIGIEFFERAFVKQHVEPLARGQLALAVLRVDALLPAPQRGGRAAAFHFGDIGGHAALHDGKPLPRSEEHTSELQSLMRISYAVFCLNTTTNYPYHYKHNYITH